MPGQSLYASYTSIYKPTLKTNADNSYLAPEVGKNYELGWKGEWMQSKLNTAVSLFQTDNTNVGVRVNVPASGNRKQTFYYVPAKERSRGVDAEFPEQSAQIGNCLPAIPTISAKQKTIPIPRAILPTGPQNTFSALTAAIRRRLQTVS